MMKRTLLVFLSLFWASSAFAQRDAIDLSQAVVWDSPRDVASWAISSRVEGMTMRPEGSSGSGVALFFNSRSRWPDYTPPGWDGPIQYTIWAGVRINGVWHVAGFIQMWRDRVSTGAPLLSFGPGCTINNFGCNWAYDRRWGAMAGYQPRAGEAMVFFATAGNARGVSTVTSVRERTNVVMVNLPANDNATFNFPRAQQDLTADLEGSGLWTLLDATTYSQVGPGNAERLVADDIDGNQIDELIADFGAAGLWIRWNNATWTQFHPGPSDGLITADLDGNGRAEVIVSFPGAGLWALVFGTTWVPLNPNNPVAMTAGDINGGGDELVVAFAGYGVAVRWSNGTWSQLHTAVPTQMLAADFDGGGADVAMSFDGAGLWVFRNGSSWTRVNTNQPVHMAAGDVDGSSAAELFADFGGGGIWMLNNLTTWVRIHGSASEQIVIADLDGSGKGDVLVDFGPAWGLWVLGNTTPWTRIIATSPRRLIAGEFN